MNVARVNYRNAVTAAPVAAPARDLGFELPLSPDDVMRRWSQTRLRPGGVAGTAQVLLAESRFASIPLEKTEGLEGVLTNDQSSRYEGAMTVRVEIAGPDGGQGFVEARARASRTVAEDFSINEREETLYDLLRGIARSLDRRLETEIRDHLAHWIVAG